MAAGDTDPHGSGTMGSEPSQGNFIGWLGVGLLGFMALFMIFIFAGAASNGFS